MKKYILLMPICLLLVLVLLLGACAKATTTTTTAPTTTAPITTYAKDGFNRTNMASGWGAAETGGTWVHTDSMGLDVSNKATIFNNEGKVSLSSSRAAIDERNLVGPSNVGDVDVTASCRVDSTVGATWALLARAGDYDNFYMARLSFAASTLSLLKNSAGSLTTLASLSTPKLRANVTYRIRFQVQGSTVSTKFWNTADPEPGTWALQGNDSTFASGQLGLRAELAAVETTANFLFDDFLATSLP